ncbi:MAG: hypothetical protein FWC89_07110 [Defluviitaleaceae bacterium]|nr:hypothetical protein [Defluviitaleaceae bacterium]
MMRLTGAIVSGVTVGLLIGAGVTTIAATDQRQRRRIMRDSRRAMRNAGHYFHDIFD